MAYRETLAVRVREVLASEHAIEERRMMGGLVFLENGNMLGGVDGDSLFVRVGAEGYAEAVQQPHVSPMDIGGRAPKGFVLVGAAGLRTDADLRRWVAVGLAYASSLPAKSPSRRSPR